MTLAVNNQSPAVAAMAQHWTVIEALMGGTAALRAAGKAFLPQQPREDVEDYQYRLKTARLFPAYARTVGVMTGKPFSKEVTLSEDTPKQLQELAQNIDGEGRSLHAFSADLMGEAMTTIEPGKVKSPEVRARVIQYQNECDDVLWQYWNDGIAVNPRTAYAVNPGDLLTKDEAETLRLMLKNAVERLPKEKQAGAMVKGWSKLKAHFGVAYREIPRHEFSEAVSIIARHATTEWELVDDEPQQIADADRIEAAFALATEAAQGVQRAVFQKVLEGQRGELWRHTRFMVALGYDGTTKQYRTPWVGALGLESVCMSPAEMAQSLRKQGGGEWCPTEVELADLGAAIAERQSRMAQRRCEDRRVAA